MQTQQMISENFAQLAFTKQDSKFINYQKDKFVSYINESIDRLELAMTQDDREIQKHVDELTARKLVDGDFNPFPIDGFSGPKADFISPLILKFSENLEQLKKR